MKTILKSFIIIGELIMLCLTIPIFFAPKAVEFDPLEVYDLSKRSGTDFTILQFTDTHVSGDAQGRREVYPYMRKWVEEVHPDLIVITGDGVQDAKADEAMHSLIAEMKNYNVPWAYVFGNHEKDADVGVRGLSKILKEAAAEDELILYQEGPFTTNDRHGNYVVNISQGKKHIYSLFMMNTGREYNTFSDEQETWYADGVRKLSEMIYGEYKPFENKVIPSMVFHHIPTDEYQYAANKVLTGSYKFDNVKVGQVPSEYGSGRNDEMAYGQTNGEYLLYEDPKSQAGFFATAKDLRSTTHMFCGHRHANDATILYEGITLSFGTKTGRGNFDGYSRSGCAVITIKDKTNKVEVKHLYDA